MPRATPAEHLPLIAAGAQVVVRDEEWLVTSVQHTPADGLMVRCTGRSPFVRDLEATFFTNLDVIEPLRPEETVLVPDDSPGFRRGRLYLESVIRKTPLAATETALAVSQHQLLDDMEYQRRAAHKALSGLRPRLLIADAVGLGKTLEVGMILSELIRRGRGERILVVTPRHILEQFQHELWTRFAIPLVRLDSEGIQRVRRSIPGNRNPFTYHRRVIISIDTLKNAGRYRHHLEGIRWDAVVIDECHNLVNRGTLNNQLARVLAPRTDALLLTSATPHNGDPKAFAELIRLLDPTAVVDPKKLDADDIAHLYVRRHKNHEEVAPELGSRWAERLPPKAVPVPPSPAEEALYAELADVWVYPVSGSAPVSGEGRSLFPWTLLKAALSSHRALAQTIENRRKTLASKADPVAGLSARQRAEDEALESLAERCAAIGDDGASKLHRLVAELREIGVGPGSPTRVVVFSERIATLDWLAATLPGRLGLDRDREVRVLHGGLTDVRQMEVIEEFSLAGSDVRLLLTGDMASEGVNLHRQCHHLIHFDLPWSLITIEQRNGRIDRYGQEHPPDVRALLATPRHPRLTGDLVVLKRLLEREDHAHRALGDAGSLFGLHAADLEEKRIAELMQRGVDPDEIVPESPKPGSFDLLVLLAGGTGTGDVPTVEPPTLFGDQAAFVDDALRFAFDDPVTELGLRSDPADPTLVSLEPPDDLVRRLRALPQSYLAEQKVAERLRLTADPEVAASELARARSDTASSWPTVGYLSPLHPFLDWLVDKVLVSVGRNEALVLRADVERPVFCVQGSYANGRGRPQVVEWLAVSPGAARPVADLFDALDEAGVGPSMTNPGTDVDVAAVQALVPAAVELARGALRERREEHDRVVEERLAEPRRRLQEWVRRCRQRERELANEPRARQLAKERRETCERVEREIESMRTSGDPLVRVLAVLVGER